METKNYFVLNNVFEENAKEYRSNPVKATKYQPGMESGWMLYISNKPPKNEKFHTHAAVKFFPTKEDAIAYVEANEKQYMRVDGKLVECEVEYSLLQPVLHRKRTTTDPEDRVGMDFMLGDYTLESDESEDYDFYILEDGIWIIQDASGNIRVWNKDFLDGGETFFGNIYKDITICENVGGNMYQEIEV